MWLGEKRTKSGYRERREEEKRSEGSPSSSRARETKKREKEASEENRNERSGSAKRLWVCASGFQTSRPDLEKWAGGDARAPLILRNMPHIFSR